MNLPPPQVLELIQRFDRNREACLSPHYNETQLRRYAWTTKLSLSVLSDFEEFAVYDRPLPCVFRPFRPRHAHFVNLCPQHVPCVSVSRT